MNRFGYRRTTLWAWFFVAVLAGLGLARINISIAVWVIMAAVFSAVTILRKLRIRPILVVIMLGVAIGFVRGGAFMQKIEPYSEYEGQKVSVTIRADNDATYNDRSQLEFDATHVTFTSPERQEVPGRMRISGFGVPAVYRGDILQVSGKLYKTRGSRQAGISFGQISIVKPTDSSFEKLRREFVAATLSSMPEPHSSLALGILIGQRTTLPERVNERLNKTGLTHIIAVSGYNLTIIVQAVRRLLKKRSKYQVVLFSGLLIAGFLFITGFSASIVRAALVSGLSLAAWYCGRAFKPVLLLLLTAAVTAYVNPLYVWSDIGWYLSFAAFYGVLVTAPAVIKRFARKEPKLIGGVVAETLCAQLLTLPIIMFIFGRVSVVSLVANLLVVPLVPFAMLFALLAGVNYMVFGSLLSWLAFPAQAILTYMLDIVKILGGLSFASVEQKISSATMIVLYIGILLVTFAAIRANRLRDTIKSDKLAKNTG